ncbi:hypothetical protein [Ectobacillus polymachus]|uniref:hypothetical protein n=1 Tax=Ectobacillus polymachus TaxID=1508806 RepID=UPI003A857A65
MYKFLTVDKAKEKIKELQIFVSLAESYIADSPEKIAIKEYAHVGNVKKVADKLNDLGYRLGNRKYISKDVTEIIEKEPTDEFHAIVKKVQRENKKANIYL